MLYSGDKKLWSEMSSDEFLEPDQEAISVPDSDEAADHADGAGDEDDDNGESRRRHPQDID